MEIPDSVAQALALGWSVIPCRREKRPCLSWKQFQSRKPTPEEIRSWQSEYNPSAWAVITGAVSGVVVLDFDGETGDQTRTALKLTPHVPITRISAVWRLFPPDAAETGYRVDTVRFAETSCLIQPG